jgi:8-oxo-dGTP diphosphatase
MSADRTVYAAGAVLWRNAGNGAVEVALVHRPRYDDWSLPKGKLHSGEHPLVAACREVVEETAAHPVAGPYLAEISYDVPAAEGTAPKSVEYWAMRAVYQDTFVPDDEVDEVRWLPVEAAHALLSYPHDEDVLARYAALPPVTGAVLLIRHGFAGSREGWDGPDAERPLDARGRAQAVAIARVLPWYSPERVLSAPQRRCVQTAEPLAFVIGVPIEVDDVLSEKNDDGDHLDAAARIREIGATGVVTAIVSQGGVIPTVVAQLAAADGLQLTKVKARKGSVWALFFHGSTLVAADYRDDLDRSPQA